MNARNRMPIRGGNWNNGSNAGLAALNLNNSRTNANNNIGFRPALDNARSCTSKECRQSNLEKDAYTPDLSEIKINPVDASIGCAYEKIYEFNNLLSAAYSCRKGRAKSKQSLRFFENLEENIVSIQNELIWGLYSPGSHRIFYVFEPKRRLIAAPEFRDRVVHRAVYNILEPLFNRIYINDSYACRKGKGTHKGMQKAKQFIRSIAKSGNTPYALKADISKYFSSIDHLVLKKILSSKIKCRRSLELLFGIIDNSYSDKEGCGIPLGNLTSQMFANIYLHELDFFVKHDLRVKKYIRYMDDFVIFGTDKKYLSDIRIQIESFINKKLLINTNNRTQIFPISKTSGRALDFLGYRIYSNKVLLRKSSIKSITTKIKRMRKGYGLGLIDQSEITPVINSWLGHASHADSGGIINKLLNEKFKRF